MRKSAFVSVGLPAVTVAGLWLIFCSSAQSARGRFGRFLIPKDLRDHIGLEAGAVLQIEKEGEKIILQPVQGEPKIMEKKEILVFTGTAVGDVGSALQEHRKRPMNKDKIHFL